MNKTVAPAIFFGIEDTLGSTVRSFPAERLVKLNIYQYITEILQQLKDKSFPVGIICNSDRETEDDLKRVLEEAEIYQFFAPDLLIYSSVVDLSKSASEIFQLAAKKAGHANAPENCLYIGEDSRERQIAKNEGWQVVPHPSLVWDVLNGSRLRYVRVTVPIEQIQKPWRTAIKALSVIPMYVTGQGNQIYAIASSSSIPTLMDLGFEVDLLGEEDDPLTTGVYLLRDDRQTNTGFLKPQGQSGSFFAGDNESKWVLASTAKKVYVALPGDRSVEEYHFERAGHGHNLKLSPDVNLLEPFEESYDARTVNLEVPSELSLSEFELAKLQTITPDSIRKYLARYTGVEPLDESTGKITSRHIHSPEIELVTEALARDFAQIGEGHFNIRLDRFVHEGRSLYNVEAELPGNSKSAEIVLVTAHLDSTAASSDDGYDPTRDPAPGADDDASGVAAVLAIANVIKQMAAIKPLKRTVRFVLFNAEEHGLVGSKAYARNQAALAAAIVGVYQMDMIGYNVAPPRSFEVHVGYPPSADVQARSLLLAQTIADLTPKVSPYLELPQIYTQPDPAAERSDHASFHERGYAACVTSEDFFVGPALDSPEAEANPNYHKKEDTFVDLDYAADIARLIAAATWVSANA